MHKPQEHKRSLSTFFAHSATFSYDQGKWVLLAFMVFLAAMMAALGQLKMDVSAEGRLHESDPIRKNYAELRQLFGRDDLILISMPTHGQLDVALLQQVQSLHRSIEQDVPYVHEVSSLMNARLNYGDDGELIIEQVMEGWSELEGEQPQQLEQILQQRWPDDSLKTFLMTNPNYQERLISSDGDYVAIVVELDAWAKQDGQSSDEGLAFTPLVQAQSAEAIVAIRQLIAAMPEAENISVTGNAVVEETLTRLVFNDTNTTGAIALSITILFLIVFFRRVSGVLMPLLVINGSLITAIGFMALNNVPWTLTFGTMPPILIAIGVADSVHILSAFYKNYAASGDKRQAIIDAIQYSAPAVLLTSLTTIAGFLSFAVADLASISNLGLYTAIAVFFALVYSVILLPALIALVPIKAVVGNTRTLGFVQRINEALVAFSTSNPKAISATAVLLLVAGIYNASSLPFSDDIMTTFPDSEVTKQDLFKIDEQYNGAGNLEVVIDSGGDEGVYAPAFLQKLQQAQDAFSNTTINGVALAEAYSVLNILKETHKSLNNNDEAFYALADNRALIAQELLLFEMSERDDLLKVVDQNFRYARLSVKMPYADGVVYEKMMMQMQQKLDEIFGKDQAMISGATALMAESIPRALTSMMKSYAIALIVISVMMAMMIGNLKIGLISMMPNLLPIVLVLNLMVWWDWPLDQNTISIGAIALGLVVDDTLHFLYHFKQYYNKSGDAVDASMRSVRGCGPALFMTTMIFSAACFGNLLSSLEPFFKFGVSLGLITLLALLVDLLVAPALLVCVFPNRGKEKSAMENTGFVLDNKPLDN